jgi:hypothetical protein
MIDPKELRIGNLVFIDNYSIPEIPMVVHTALTEFLHLKEIGSNLIFSHPCSRAHPIPITHEWLERLGFELNKPCGDEGFIKWKHKDGVYLLWIEGKFWHDHWSTGIWVTSIHQLQNLYYALTGEELTTKK